MNDSAAGYCGKLLLLREGAQGSLHYHIRKDETMLVVSGRVALELHDRTLMLDPGEYIRLRPATVHRFRAMTPFALIAEFSTPHSDDDVTRLEDSRTLSTPDAS